MISLKSKSMLFSNKYIRKKGMFMKRKIKSVKGFTLAELLIVVAIIAVLVAIGIPIFTSQLEKSREAVDLSDVRSAYAEVMMAAITGDTTAIYTKDASQMIYKNAEKEYSITVKPLKQKQDGWQTALPITIGGVSSTDNVHWVNKETMLHSIGMAAIAEIAAPMGIRVLVRIMETMVKMVALEKIIIREVQQIQETMNLLIIQIQVTL